HARARCARTPDSARRSRSSDSPLDRRSAHQTSLPDWRTGVAGARESDFFVERRRRHSRMTPAPPMKLVSHILAALLAILGVVFVAGNQGVVLRVVVGAILLAASVALVVASRLRPRQTHLVQKIDLTGSIEAKAVACTKC